jgi:hypothetical protein
MSCARAASLLLVLSLICLTSAADEPSRRSPKEALQGLNDLIGTWKATGEPNGTRAEKMKNFWIEKVGWEWRFKGSDAWLSAAFDKGKYFSAAELHYLPERGVFVLKITTTAKETLSFEGKLDDHRLTLERRDESRQEVQRLVFSLLHFNRHLYRYETRPMDRPTFTMVWQVGATKEGVAFATVDEGPECIVSGGLGTIPVTYQGKTYYVCCTGCRDAFREEPEKYIKEYEARKKKK